MIRMIMLAVAIVAIVSLVVGSTCASVPLGHYEVEWVEYKDDNSSGAGSSQHDEDSDVSTGSGWASLEASSSLSAGQEEADFKSEAWASASFVVRWVGEGTAPGGTITYSGSVSGDNSSSGSGDEGWGIGSAVSGFGGGDFGCEFESCGIYSNYLGSAQVNWYLNNMVIPVGDPTKVEQSSPTSFNTSLSNVYAVGETEEEERDFTVELDEGTTYYCISFCIDSECRIDQNYPYGSKSMSCSSETSAEVSCSFEAND